MNIERFDNEDVLASTLAARLIEAISLKPRIVLGLPTGRTPVALYREVRSRSHRGHVDWSQVRPLESLLKARPPVTDIAVFKSVGSALWDLAAARVAVANCFGS